MPSDKGSGHWGTLREELRHRAPISRGRDERFPGLATELGRLKVHLILTRGTRATLAAKNATRTIPVGITGVGDPVGQGLVAISPTLAGMSRA
jgi:hypothetical protein